MSEIIYAIIKDYETSKLRKISESTSSSRSISDEELCRFHNYAIDLYEAYCSCIPYVNITDKVPDYRNRREAVEFEDAIERLKNKYQDKLIAYSHRQGGWTTFQWRFNENVEFEINTNFGFGSNSYFEQSIYYKGLKLAPYSKLVKYRYANFTSITSHTYEYPLAYSEWSKLMDDALDFYNAVVERQEHYIFHWLSNHLEKMVTELERYINASYCYFDNIIKKSNYYSTSSERVEGDDFWIAKSNKISEALLFITNIKELPVQVNPSKYITRIRNINKSFLPKLIEKICMLELEINELETQIRNISSRMPLSLYIKLYDKYYYSKNWHLSKNKFAMLMFLMRMLRRKSNITISNIKQEITILKKQIKEWKELKEKLNRIKSVNDELSKDKEKIIVFFNTTEDSKD